MTLRAEANEFGLIIESAAFNSAGNTMTPGNNTYGSFASIISGASVTDDVYGFWLCIDGSAVSGAARNCLVKIGLDPAGGTSFSQLLISDLSGSCAGFNSQFNSAVGGIWYWFPLFIKAGTSIGSAASVNNATVGACQAYVRLHCKPSRPDLLRVGTFVRTFGSTPASSSGTAITPGTGAKSSYVQLGSATADNLWWWNLGVFCNNNAMNDNMSFWDLAIGDASNKRNVIPDQWVIPSSSETLAFRSYGGYAQSAPGDLVYARAGGISASPTGMSVAAYAVGG